MKHLYHKIVFLVIFAFSFSNGNAQQKFSAAPVFSADSLLSGNNKDILTSFFQLAFDNLVGENKEFNFNTNPFAVMLKSNPNLDMDHNYKKYKALRKLNFGFGLRVDTSFKFNGFSSGIKYALINERDHTTSKYFADRLKADPLLAERTILNEELTKFVSENFDPATQLQELLAYRKNISLLFNKETAFNSLPASFQNDVLAIADKRNLVNIKTLLSNNPASSLREKNVQDFNALKEEIKKAALWTIGISDTTYKDQFAFSNVVISSDFSKGIFKPKAGGNNVELNINAAGNFLKDTLQPGNNLKRFILDVEAGLNWVIRDKQNDRSLLELKAGGTYYHNFTSLYAGEERDRMTLNGTLRVRIYEDIWVPLEFKYDPDNGNVFGFLNVKANFTGLSKFIKEANR